MIWLLLAVVGVVAGGATWLVAGYGPAVTAAAVGAVWIAGRAVTRDTRRRSVGDDGKSTAPPSPSQPPATREDGEDALVRRIEQQGQVAAEVELAAAVQSALIPDGRPRTVGPVVLAGSYVPASRCGGDWWIAYELPGGGVLVLVADVTGHGIGAARITAAARAACDATMRLAGGEPDLGDLMVALDAAVRRVGVGHYNMTCFAAIFEPSRTARFISAGHVAPYVVRSTLGDDGKVSIDALVGRGNPLGLLGTTPETRVLERTLEAGDLLLFYTDGLVDCVNPAGERLGDRRMQRALRDIGAAAPLEIGAVRDRIESLAGDFTGGAPQPDDITFVTLRLT